MDSIVLIMVLSIYVGAIAAPLALFILSRRTGHGAIWQSLVGACAALIWAALVLGFLREFLNVQISRDLLELAGLGAVLSFAILAVVALVMVSRPWSDRAATKEARYHAKRFSPFVTDIE